MDSARILFEYGARAQGYWKGKDLYRQVVNQALPIFERMHGTGPNGQPYQALFVFDNAAVHKVFAEDALIARNLNLTDGGAKVPKSRDTEFEKDGVMVEQLMQFDKETEKDGEVVVENLQKGIKRILVERDKWPTNGRRFLKKCELCSSKVLDDPERSFRNDCCATRMLEAEPDFAAQKSLLAEVIEKAGHLAIFLPKFHPELNRAFLSPVFHH